MKMKDENPVIFNSEEDMINFYYERYLYFNKIYNEDEYYKTPTCQIKIFGLISKSAKYMRKLGKYVDSSIIYGKFINVIYDKLDKIVPYKDFQYNIDYDNYFIKLYDEAETYYLVANNILAALGYVIYGNNFELDEFTLSSVFAIYHTTARLHDNIVKYIEDKKLAIEYSKKHITYVSKNKIDLKAQINFIFDKIIESGIYDMFKKFFVDTYGEDYYLLKMIPNK